MCCHGECGKDCALLMTIDWLDFAVGMQMREYHINRTSTIPYLDAMFQLHGYVRAGVCQKTATLPFEYLPDLNPLLRQLPNELLVPLALSIRQAAGQRARCRNKTVRLRYYPRRKSG